MEAPGHDLTPIRRMKRPATPQVCEWVNISWESVKHEAFVKSFSISSSLDGTENGTLFEGSENWDLNISDECDRGDEDFLGCITVLFSKYLWIRV
jgi:hypothetical protein